MNNLAAHLVRVSARDAGRAQSPRRRPARAASPPPPLLAQLTNLTAGMRFEGPLNVDLNEISSCLVPFPRMHLLQSSLAPLFASPDAAASYGQSRVVDAMFAAAFAPGAQLLRGDPHAAVHLACGLLARGDVPLSDVTRNVGRLRRELRMAAWNPDGFKVGICAARALHAPQALLALSNNTAAAATLRAARARCARLRRVGAHLHHYAEYMDLAGFDEADEALADVIGAYEEVAREG